METIAFTKNTLAEFVKSDFYNNLTNIPISKQRAISQINNPRADDTDVLLIAQFDGNKTVGYLGILPDYIYSNGTKEKFGWLTCFWVDEAYKSQGVAANIFRRVIRAWEQKIFITNFVPWLEPIYQKTKIFQPTQFKTGFRGYFRFNLAEILPPKKNFFQNIKGILNITDKGLNLVSDVRLSFFQCKDVKNLKFEYHSNSNDVATKILEISEEDNCILRGKEELDWILKYPWLIEGATTDYNSNRYYFSLLSKRFFYQLISFSTAKNERTDFLLLKIRDNEISIPYIFSDKSALDTIALFIIYTMKELKINMVTTYDSDLALALKRHRKYFIFTKKIKKPYLISKKIVLDKLSFQDGDGDCVFY